MRRIKSLVPAILVLFAMGAALCPAVSFSEEAAAGQSQAFAALGQPIEEQNMTFVDGMEKGVSDAADPLYSEYFEMEGIQARKVYKENYIYFRLDKDFYQPTDRDFVILVEYWDFGPDPGWFHVEYNSADGTANKRVSIQKTGRVQKWCTARIFVNDAEFGGKMDENADIRLVSNAYNAFSRISVYNIAAAARGGEEIDIGVVNQEKADILHGLGLYRGASETEYAPMLEKEVTRYEMLSMLIDGVAETKAANRQKSCGFQDVREEQAAVVGYAEDQNWIVGNEKNEFRPDDTATPRELMTVYLRMLGYEDENLYETAYEKANEIGLIYNENIILSGDIALTRDHFVAMAYNALNLKNIKTNVSVINRMVANNNIEAESLKGSEFEGAMYAKPVKIEKRIIFDDVAQREYYYMNLNGARAIRPYVTQQHWKSDGSKFLISNDIHKAMYEYDVETEELKKLDETTGSSGSAEAVVTPDDKIFYRRSASEYYLMDWNTGAAKKVLDVPQGVTTSVMSITNDLKYASGYWLENLAPEDSLNGVNRYRIAPQINLETGEINKSVHHEFDELPEFPHLGHAQINPVDPDLIMFCHEGTTQYIHDRIWLGRVSTGETWNLFHQAKLSDTLTGETTGHEIWAPDGQSVFFVKYYFPNQNIGQQGIVRVDLNGEREYINGDYRYWHCYPSADNNWVAADTQLGSASEIVLMNTNTYETHVLAKFATPSGPQHPYQPHPIISNDGSYVSWQMIDETGMLGVGWADIREFTQNPKENQRVALSDGVEMITNPDAVSKTAKQEDKGETYYQAEPGCGVYCDLEEKYDADKGRDVTLRITYMDNGRQPLDIHYTSSVKSEAELAKREDANVSILRTGTGAWKTAEVTLKDMNLANAGKFKSDLYITGNLYSNVKIKNVEVVN